MAGQQASSESLSNSNVQRPLADFPADIWGDQFLDYHFDEMAYARKEKQVHELAKEVKRELLELADDPLMQLKFIDAIQRLDVAYHFEVEIEEALQRIYDDHQHHLQDDNLYNVSLFFRILRQEGFNVSSDLFNKFKNDEGNFKESLITDVSGMLGLYEAAQLSVHGEEVLDEALDFTTTQLKAIAPSIKQYPLAAQVSRALRQKLRQGLPRLEAKHFIYIYQDTASHNKALLKLAKIDFNLLQSLHRKEISMLSRCFLAKVIALITVVDDMYDAYGTLEELAVFTDAINRWDISCIDKLSTYMQQCYQANLDCFKDIEDELAMQGKTYRIQYAREAWKFIIRGYMKEAEWMNANHIPSVEEHYEVAILLTSYLPLINASLVGMDESVTKETFEWSGAEYPNKASKMVKALETVGRLIDDFATHKFEQNRPHVASSVECYMNQYGISEEKAYEVLKKKVEDARKDINQGFLRPTEMPKPVLMRVLNLARFSEVHFWDGDSFTRLGLKDTVTSLLIDAVPNDDDLL
ncbi:hypothetical protein FNV43_RR21556 [Rhamnella rubrinervis]|uniref:Uncharacterized protein n=1 Tax=Rhamnella rubrinervis TaxID=2594499 RepID=A0A8K0GV55_9ROSA|nr:hypothetical protein FNV43_RR21556 [Rhamnella rubrinervis]